jgi:hypothetical protein
MRLHIKKESHPVNGESWCNPIVIRLNLAGAYTFDSKRACSMDVYNLEFSVSLYLIPGTLRVRNNTRHSVITENALKPEVIV